MQNLKGPNKEDRLRSQLSDPSTLHQAFNIPYPEPEQAPIRQMQDIQPYHDFVQPYLNSGGQELPLQRSGMEPKIDPINISIPHESTVWDDLREALSNAPQRQNYQPSTGRKIAGAIAGGLTGAAYGPETGSKVSGGIVDKPYHDAYQDWLVKTGALGQEANIEIARGNLDVNKQRAAYSGLSDLASLMRAQASSDPELQGDIEGAKEGARESAREPGRQQRSKEKVALTQLEDRLTRERNTALENQRQKGRVDLAEKGIKAKWDQLLKSLHSKESISAANRELKRQLETAKIHRIPVRDQALAEQLADKRLAGISSKMELEKFFTPVTDKQGNNIGYTLKNEGEITDPVYQNLYKSLKAQRDQLSQKILSNSPGMSDRFGIDSEDDEEESPEEDRFEVEEVD